MLRPGRFPKDSPGNREYTIYILCGLSVVFFALLKLYPQKGADAFRDEKIQASKIMRNAMGILKECCLEKSLSIDRSSDINGTGLIGMEHSEITTSIGSLGSKRTSTNPNFAGLVVHLLQECGIQKGDAIAIGASSSFPALIVASLAAAEALDLNPLWIFSLGASQWGANRPEFHWLHMWRCLENSNLFSHPPLALSLGGEGDTGEDMDERGRQLLWEDIRASGLRLINEPDLAQNVALRMAQFEKAARGKEIKAFINIGGSWSNMGIDSMVLHVKPGLNRIEKLPPPERRGVIYAMADKGIPVIHLLYVRGLTQRYGLPWDPSPLPDPGEGAFYTSAGENQTFVSGLAATYVFFILFVLVISRKRGSLAGKNRPLS
jgi:poly-gamma-glutamate system protein